MKIPMGAGLILAATLSGCGPQGLLEERRRTEAPRGPEDLGVILENTKTEDIDELLAKAPQARVRVLNADHGLYEIFGVDTQTVQKVVGQRAQPNTFIRLRDSTSKLSRSAPVGLKVPGLNVCRSGVEYPTAKLTVLSPRADLNGASVEIGQSLKLSSKESQTSQKSDKTLKSAFVISAPGSGKSRETFAAGAEYEFTPDALGAYQAFVVVQDAGDTCAIDGIQFVVTANRPFKGKADQKFEINVNDLKHLQTVKAQAAWALSEGDGVTVAVIDSGVNYNHPSLAPNIFENAREIPGNGVDDDGNGFVDDVLGYDFVNGDGFPYDDDGHGTHVAGLAASRHFGLARRANILAIKALTGLGGDSGSIAAAIHYAVDRGAKVINLSLGGQTDTPHPALVRAVEYAESKGVVLVAAAGNGEAFTGLGFDIDKTPVYPASLNHENIIGVGSSQSTSPITSYSNFGVRHVEVVAPGGDMPSDPMMSAAYENPENTLMAGMSGTSMATPVVAGVIAQMLSANPSLSPADVKRILLTAGEPVEKLKTLCASGRILDAQSAVYMALPKYVLN